MFTDTFQMQRSANHYISVEELHKKNVCKTANNALDAVPVER